jgi:hypothetical protein
MSAIIMLAAFDLVDEAHTMIANLRAECTLRSVGW